MLLSKKMSVFMALNLNLRSITAVSLLSLCTHRDYANQFESEKRYSYKVSQSVILFGIMLLVWALHVSPDFCQYLKNPTNFLNEKDEKEYFIRGLSYSVCKPQSLKLTSFQIVVIVL